MLRNSLLDFWSRFRRSSFAQGVVRISLGTGIGYGAWFAVSPMLSRIYTPQDFAVWGLVLSYVGIVSPFLSLRYELALVRANDAEEAHHLLLINCVLTVAMSTLAVAFLFLFSQFRKGGWTGIHSAPEYFIFFLILIGSGFYTNMRFFALGYQEFTTIGASSAWQNILRGLSALVLGLISISKGLLLERF